MKIKKSMKRAASLLANAYISAKGGKTEEAGAYLVAACETDDIDYIMHGVAASVGITDDNLPDDEEDYDDVESGCDMNAGEEEEEDVTEEVKEEDDESEDNEDDDEGEEDPDKKIEVPASCLRLAKMRY